MPGFFFKVSFHRFCSFGCFFFGEIVVNISCMNIGYIGTFYDGGDVNYGRLLNEHARFVLTI